MKNQIRVYLNDQELSMVNELVEKKGLRAQDVFRNGLRSIYAAELPPPPPYIVPKPVKKQIIVSKEEKCIQDGGTIEMRGDVKKCIITRGDCH